MDTIEKLRFCRACGSAVMNPCEIKNNPAKPDLTLLLKRYIPEFDIEVDNPCLCEGCVTTLYKFHNFKKKCWRTEENVRLHIRKHPEVETVDLYEIFAPAEEKNNIISNTTKKETSTTPKKIKCKLCNRVLSHRQSLKSHLRKYHKHLRHQCNKCSRDFYSKADYDKHVAYHEKPKSGRFICKKCNFVYHSAAALKTHNIYKHMSEDQKPYQCELCGMRFVLKVSLLIHMRVHEKKNEKTKDDVIDNLRKYKCTVCDYATNRKLEMSKHLAAEHNQRDTSKVHCKMCHRLLARDAMTAHKRLFHGRARYNCTQCDREFSIKSAYDKHVEYHKKPNADRFRCKICNFSYQSSGALGKHRMSRHVSTDQRPFQCEVCSMRFVENSILITHMQSHATDLRFKCSLCNYTAKHKGTVRNHFKAKHKGHTFLSKDVVSFNKS